MTGMAEHYINLRGNDPHTSTQNGYEQTNKQANNIRS